MTDPQNTTDEKSTDDKTAAESLGGTLHEYEQAQAQFRRETYEDSRHRAPHGNIPVFDPIGETEPRSFGAKAFGVLATITAALYAPVLRAQDWVKHNVSGDIALKVGLASVAFGFAKPALSPIRKARRWVTSLGPALVPPQTTITVQAQPQCLFRGEKFIASGDLRDLYIQGMFVGQKSQLPTFQSPIALEVFRAGVTENVLRMDTCDPALFITLQVQNTSKEPREFAFAIIGEAIM